MELLRALMVVSEKAANLARLCRHDSHLFGLLVQKKTSQEANPRFVDDFKTLADVLIQEVVWHDIGERFPELRSSIRGEENNTFTNGLGETIRVEIKDSVEETAELLEIVLNRDKEAAQLLAAEAHRKVDLDEVQTARFPSEEFEIELADLGIWIDPIDSTAEYINGVEVTGSGICISGLKCVTVLIGAFDKKSGLPVMGVVNQPFANQDGDRWIGECFWGGPSETSLPPIAAPTRTICVSGSEDPSIIARLEENDYNTVEASGAGYKILTVLTGLADAYILSKDTTFKWDTCGPQAILRAAGGDVVVFDDAVKSGVVSVGYDAGNGNGCNSGGIVAYRERAVLEEIVRCLSEF